MCLDISTSGKAILLEVGSDHLHPGYDLGPLYGGVQPIDLPPSPSVSPSRQLDVGGMNASHPWGFLSRSPALATVIFSKVLQWRRGRGLSG